jgi:hypothetical protein
MDFITFVFKGLIMHYAIGTYYKEVKVQLHESATSALDENGW